ncbi:MAG: class I SAM-dependent methyltransferase [Candidatus Schekmanbacteria bacterium]|nr:class I SAM-dependent methyltransferase [Candidatus Schekmanbacteria bacterium]
MNNQAMQAATYRRTSDWQYVRGMRLLDLASLQGGENVLDLGCGTGQLTFELARRVAPMGKVIAIDPDVERLKIAQATMPPDIRNLTFFEAKAENLTQIADQSIDLIFSNYVIHWIPDKNSCFEEIIRCLHPGGRCVMELVGELMPFLRDVTILTGEPGRKLVNKFCCLTQNEWIGFFKQNNLIVEHTDWPDLDFEFNTFCDFLDWWEGTTHGAFLRTMLPGDAIQQMQQQYADRVTFGGNAFQGVVRKPHSPERSADN